MAPGVIDLTSSPEPDESPARAARSALQGFHPRKEKTNGARNGQSSSRVEESARNALQEFIPQRQGNSVASSGYSLLATYEDTHPPSPDDARTELQNTRQANGSHTPRQTQAFQPPSKRRGLATNKPARPTFKPPTNFSHGHSARQQSYPARIEEGSLAGLLLKQEADATFTRRDFELNAINTTAGPNFASQQWQNTGTNAPQSPRQEQTFRPPSVQQKSATNGKARSPTATKAQSPTGVLQRPGPSQIPRSPSTQKRSTANGTAMSPTAATTQSTMQGPSKSREQRSEADEPPIQQPRSLVETKTAQGRPAPTNEVISLESDDENEVPANAQAPSHNDTVESNNDGPRPHKRQRLDESDSSSAHPLLSSLDRREQQGSTPVAVASPTAGILEFQATEPAEPAQGVDEEMIWNEYRTVTTPSEQKKKKGPAAGTGRRSAAALLGTSLSNASRLATEQPGDAASSRSNSRERLKTITTADNKRFSYNIRRTEAAMGKRLGTPNPLSSSRSSTLSSPPSSSKFKEAERSAGNQPARAGGMPDLRTNNASSNHGFLYTPEEDTLLKKLKEEDNLSWQEIAPYFNGRSTGSLQVRYSSKLKSRQGVTQRGSNLGTVKSAAMARSETPDDSGAVRPSRRKRNTEVSAVAGFVSWADVRKRRGQVDDESFDTQGETDSEKRHRRGAQFSTERAYPKSTSRILRQRELGSNVGRSWKPSSSVPEELKEHVFDDVGPRRFFKGTSSDVTSIAWAPDGERFAAGSIAITDERSMQYNKPNNLLLGDYKRSLLAELPDHHLPRPQVKSDTGNVNGLHSMRETQDPRLFMTVASVQFSPDSKTLYSAGSDCKVRAYGYENGVDRASCLYEIEHPAPLDLLSVSNFGTLATACHQSSDGSISIYDGQMRALSLSPSRNDLQTARAIYPSALKWGAAYRHSHLLLAGFSIDSVDAERDIAGETCLWDIRSETRLPVPAVTRNVFDVAWNPAPSLRSPVFAVASTPGTKRANRGTKSVVQCFSSRQGRPKRVMELECPAFDINDVVFCPHDENLIAVGATDGKAYVWDLRLTASNQGPLHVLEHDASLSVLDHDRNREIADTGIRFLSWGATSSRLYSGSSDGVVKIWNPYRSWEDAHVKDVATFTSAVMSGAFSPDYRELLIGEDQGRINLLSVGHGNKAVRSMERFELKSAPAPSSGSDEGIPESHKISRELLNSQQISLESMGALPIRQAVQGPNYSGPHLCPSTQEIQSAQHTLELARNDQNEVDVAISQNNTYGQSLRDAETRVLEAEETIRRLETRYDDSIALQPKAEALQHSFHESKERHQKLRNSLDGLVKQCTLDCNYLPTNVDEDLEVPDSQRSEGRIPSSLWREPDVRIADLTAEELVEAGLTGKCMSCFGPTAASKGKMSLCQRCSCLRKGLTASCEICSRAMRPNDESSDPNLCEGCWFACFRCGRSGAISRDADYVACASCNLTWRAGVLGYELVNSTRSSKSSKIKDDEQELEDEDEEDLGKGELEYYASRWQDKQ